MIRGLFKPSAKIEGFALIYVVSKAKECIAGGVGVGGLARVIDVEHWLHVELGRCSKVIPYRRTGVPAETLRLMCVCLSRCAGTHDYVSILQVLNWLCDGTPYEQYREILKSDIRTIEQLVNIRSNYIRTIDHAPKSEPSSKAPRRYIHRSV